ncbi:hypothetical protein ACFX1S_027590 [Malus domestica]
MRFEDLSRTGCKNLFRSILVQSNGESQLSLDFETVEWGLRLKGLCDCDPNAKGTQVKLGERTDGYQCRCVDGFDSDGFNHGSGYRRD